MGECIIEFGVFFSETYIALEFIFAGFQVLGKLGDGKN